MEMTLMRETAGYSNFRQTQITSSQQLFSPRNSALNHVLIRTQPSGLFK
jgi:hypothetical protein